jgi:hypothetical protein
VKRVLAHILVFIVVFLISLAIFFPFDQAAKKGLNTIINNNKLPIYYTNLNVGLFSAVIEEVAIYFNGAMVDLGDINLSYSPFSLINHKVSAAMENGFVAVSAQNTKNAVNAAADIDTERISKIVGQSATGNVKINFTYEYAVKNGLWDASSEHFAFQTPFMKVSGNNLKANGIISNNTFMIQSFSSEGDFPITLEGQIRLDPSNITGSRLNLNGEIALAGSPTQFALQGTIASPKFSLR